MATLITIPKGLELTRLEPILLQAKLQSTNPPLYQTILALLRNTQGLVNILSDNIGTVNDGSGSGGITELTGDVTAGPGTGSQVATIPADTVQYAQMQNVSAASRLLGRGSAAGAGNVEEIVVGAGLNMSGTTLTATAGSGALQWDLLTNGDLLEPELIFANGDVIWVNVP